MRVSDFEFELPAAAIAQSPPSERGHSRLLTLDRSCGAIADDLFASLPDLLTAGDVLVLNNSRVFPARLLGRRLPGGGAMECLLVRRQRVERADAETWEALVHPGQRLPPGSRFICGTKDDELHGEVLQQLWHGRRSVRLWSDGTAVQEIVDRIGHVPLPPYIKRADEAADRERYQTVYAGDRGSIAAPTAGLHFTRDILERCARQGIANVEITLHVGYGTFQPVRVSDVEEHRVEEEHYSITADAATALNQARAEGRRIIAVGTTTTRALESAWIDAGGAIEAGARATSLFIHPGFRFHVVGGLLTNFHLPRSSLLFLVSAFGGVEPTRRAYEHALAAGYRFYSYGDAMLVM